MHFSNLFSWSYWFVQPEPVVGTVQSLWLAILLGLIAIGIFFSFYQRHTVDRGIALMSRRLSNCLTATGIVGLVFFLFRQERVVLLGWRVWFFPWSVVLVVWLARLAQYWFKRVPVIRAEQQSRVEREEYLPKNKK